MIAVLDVTVPFFALVLVGWLADRGRVMPAGSVSALNAFVLYFALPCLLFRFVTQTPLAQLSSPAVAGVYGVVAVVVVAAAFVVSRRRGADRTDAAFGALVAAFPNMGFMGVPLITALLGPTAAGPVICTLLVDMIVTSSLCMALAQTHGGGGRAATVLRTLRGVASNPLPWSIVLGAVVSAGGATPPAAIDRLVTMLASAATPTALFAIGVALGSSRAVDDAVRRPVATADVALLSTLKLFVHPAAIALVGLIAMRAGAPLSPFAWRVMVLVAALPSAGNAMMLAERNGANGARIAWVILVTTSLSFVTFSVLAWLVAGSSG